MAEDKPLALIEQRTAVFRPQVARILRQVVLAGNVLRRTAGHVKRGIVVQALRINIGCQKRDSVSEALAQAGLEPVVLGVDYSGKVRHRSITAIRFRLVQCAARVRPPLIDVGFGGAWLAAAGAGNKDCRIRFNEARQLGALGPHIADLQQPAIGKGALHRQVPVLSVRQAHARIERIESDRVVIAGSVGIDACGRVGKVWPADLDDFEPRGSRDNVL
jgi:hypothetical protein